MPNGNRNTTNRRAYRLAIRSLQTIKSGCSATITVYKINFIRQSFRMNQSFTIQLFRNE